MAKDSGEIIQNNRAIIAEELFYWLSVALAIFIVLEIIWPNLILAYFNLNYLILLWLLSGVGVLIVKK